MKTTEVNEQIIGKRCKANFAAKMVAGTIVTIKKDEYSISVEVQFDEPQQWHEGSYDSWPMWSRFSDGFGTLNSLEIIDDKYQALRIKFSKSIKMISREMAQNYSLWGVVNLKEWIDNYEITRFTQIDSHTAIITSEYNMDSVFEWLQKNTVVCSYKFILG